MKIQGNCLPQIDECTINFGKCFLIRFLGGGIFGLVGVSIFGLPGEAIVIGAFIPVLLSIWMPNR